MTEQQKTIITQSAIKSYLDCPRYYENRYEVGIVKADEDITALRVGTNFHEVLEDRDNGQPLEACLDRLDKTYHDREVSQEMTQEYCRLVGMTKFYFENYHFDGFRTIKTEEKIEMFLVNPETGSKSRSFAFQGKYDGLIEDNEGPALLEHKTASQIGKDYIDRVSLFDIQTRLYCTALDLDRVLYNVVKKPTIKLRKNDTEEIYIERILDWYREDSQEKVFRAWLTITPEDKAEAMQIAWDVGQKILMDRRTGRFTQNPGNCFKWHRPCSYWELCTSKNNPSVLENKYKKKVAHSELVEQSKPF